MCEWCALGVSESRSWWVMGVVVSGGCRCGSLEGDSESGGGCLREFHCCVRFALATVKLGCGEAWRL